MNIRRLAFTLALPLAALAQDAKTILQNAEKSLGTVRSIQYSGPGMNAFFGQALTAGKEWPRRELSSYTRKINYDQKSSSEQLVFKEAVFGGQQQNTQVNGDKAWNVGANGQPAPQPATAEARQLQIWLTPHGFVKAALAANASSRSRNVVSFTTLGKYVVVGTFDAQGMLTKVETTLPDPVLGDMAVVTTYADYKDYSGVKFPSKILQTQGGFPVWDLTITAVQPNAPADLPVPAAVQSAMIPPVTVQSTKLADGVWLLAGGSHHSLLVEFGNYLTIVEGPQNEDRSVAVINEAKKLVPNKPIRYVVSTHHHFDHSGGLRTYVAEGATVVTHASNKSYFEKSFVAPAALVPDRQSKAKKKPSIQTVNDKYTISDGKQTIEVYSTQGDTHTDELLVAYLPGPKILVEADSFSPQAPNAAPPSPAPPNAVALYNNIQRLKLDVQTIAPIHGRGAVPMAELVKFIGKS
jgi:glyoxylase-like metal-dependent hydrolase (beta-lactamase superfamily II)